MERLLAAEAHNRQQMGHEAIFKVERIEEMTKEAEAA